MSLLRRDVTPVEGGDTMNGDNHPSCRRRLFADEEEEDGDDLQPGAEDNLANFLQEELRKARDAATEYWNFDFQREQPLEGRWQWEAVEPEPQDGDGRPHVEAPLTAPSDKEDEEEEGTPPAETN